MNVKYRTIFPDFVLKKTQIDKSKFNSTLALKCKPFIDSYIYGLEYTYPYNTTLTVSSINDEIIFDVEDNWEKDANILKLVENKPIGTIDSGYFGLASGLDIKVPEGYSLRIEPHPSLLFESEINVVSGHLETFWWPNLMFLVFKAPLNGESIVFKKGMPLAQFLIVPTELNYVIEKMTVEEIEERRNLSKQISDSRKYLSKKYKDKKGNYFDSTYKVLAQNFRNFGLQGILKLLQIGNKTIINLKKKLFKKKEA